MLHSILLCSSPSKLTIVPFFPHNLTDWDDSRAAIGIRMGIEMKGDGVSPFKSLFRQNQITVSN